MACALAMTGMAQAANGPIGGQIIAGSGSIQQSGLTTTIQQNSPSLQLNWQSFNVGADQTVNFVQPGRSAVAVNRVYSNNPSEIYGHLNANGQVWLINPNGVLFGKSAQVNVGGIVASTLDTTSDGVTGNQHSFSGPGAGRVVNQGVINAANGGYVALLGNQVSNQGVISARLGTVALAGGSAVTLTFNDTKLVRVQVDQSTLNNLAENRELIVADGGQVLMTAGAKDSLLASVVNNTGKVRAQSVENHDGVITLVGGMTAGQVNVGGQLDASAPNGGNGGAIETSAAHFALAPDAQITAAAPHGRAGTWLVDPTDLTIDTAAASTISTTLNGGTNVVEQTTATGASGAGTQTPGNGDITVTAPITWTNSAASLTLDAYNAINVNAAINGAGGVTMLAPAGTLTIGAGASIVGGTGVTLSTAKFVNNGGATAVSTGTSSPWLIYSANPTANTVGGLTPSFIQYNAPYAKAPAASGNGFLYSLAPTVAATGLTGTISKVYDGTTTAALTGANLQASGLVNGDQIKSATGSYARANAGSNIVVTSPTTTAGLAFVDSTGTIPVYGYLLNNATVSAAIGTITQAPLTASIVNNPTKVYDGTTSATLTASDYSFSGFVAGQGATVNQASSVSYATPNAGSGIAMSATFTPTNFVANSGTNLNNYIVPSTATGTGTITQAPLLVTGLTTSDKVYDGTRAASLNSSGAALFGLISTDAGQVTLDSSAANAAFVTPNVGTNIQVLATGFVLGGGKAANYFLEPTGYLEADITLRPLTITGVTANNKVYDGTTAATLNVGSAGISGLVPSDAGNVVLSSTGTSGTFSQSAVGNNLAVSASGFTLSGSAASNYSVSGFSSGITANITPAPLTISFLGSPTKVYDGTTGVVLDQSNYSISGFVAGQSATIAQFSGSGYATSHAGTNIPVTVALTASDFVPATGTSMSNYTFPTNDTNLNGIITPQPIQVDIVNNPSKVYDGNDVATLGSGNYQVTGTIPGEQITLSPYPTSGTYASSNVGFWTVTTSLTPGNFTAGPNTLLSDYLLPTTATGLGTIYKRQIGPAYFTVDITGNPSKVYDGTTVATIPAGDFTLSGFVPGQGATVNQTVIGDYATKDAGSQPVHATMLQSYFTPNAGTDLNNYTFPIDAYGTGTIIPAPLTAFITGDPTKVYNRSNLAARNNLQFVIGGFVSGEGATITPTTNFYYASANAGNWLISGTLVPSNFTANAGTLLTNYTLPTSATGPGTIIQAPLYVINTYANNKVYDTTTAATLNVASATLSGLVSGDEGSVTLNTSTTGTFAQSNVGNGIAVSTNGFSISGSAAPNYLLQPIAGLTANITPAPLTILGADANDKIYDGTTLATINTSGASLSGVLGGDNVTLNAASGTGNFITSNVGNSLLVNTSGFTLSGAQAGNYSVSQPYGLTANITPRPLTVSITGNPVKAYDGTTSVSLSPSDYTITGFVSGQSGSINGSTSSGYLSPNVGTNIGLQATLEPSNYSAPTGTLLSNYLLPTTATGPLGQITAALITLTGTRVYDASTNADASVFSVNGFVNGVNGQTLGLTGAGTLSSKNVGIHVPLSSLGTLALTDGTGLAQNYQLNTAANDWVTITPATLTVLNTVAASKVYDGNRNAALSGATLNGVLPGDVVTLGNDTVGTFDTKNVGTNKPVTTSMTISGTDAGNYNLIQPTGLIADITQLGVTVTVTGKNRQYDGTNLAQVSYSSNVVSTDSIGYSATSSTFSQSDVGSNLPVTVTGIALTGADAGNYNLLNTTATTAADITQRILNLTATRIYDTTSIADASLFGGGQLAGVNGETLTLGGQGSVADKNVGTQKPMDVTGFTLTGNGTAKASNYTLAGGTDWLTIDPAILTVINTVAQSKVYDGTTDATLTGATLSGVLGSDVVTLGNDTLGTFAQKDVGTNIAVSTNMNITGTDAGNYVIQQPGGLAANIYRKAISTVVNASADSKAYDGTTTATVTLDSPGVIAGDNVTYAYTSANFSQKDVGNGLTVTVDGITEGGADAGNYIFQNTTATTTADITQRILNLQGTRVYDGTDIALATIFGTNHDGVIDGVNGETLTLSGSAQLIDKNVGNQKSFISGPAVSNGYTLTGNNGALASNYTLIDGTDWVTIIPFNLTVSGLTSVPKVYDANTIAALQGGTLVGVFGTDQVTLNNATTGTFDTKNVGNGKTVTLGALSLGGTDAGNYTLSQPGNLTDGVITPLTISVVASAFNKAYDTTTAATLSNLSSTGLLGSDIVTFSAGSSNFDTANVGNGKTVTVDGITASGADAANYLFNTTATTTANITPYILRLNGARVYDATTGADASVFGTNGVVNGLGGQTLTVTGAGTLVSKNVGTQALSNLGTLALTDGTGLAANYQLDVAANDSVLISARPITVQATGTNKVYDGDADATVTLGSGGVLGTDNVTFNYTSALFNNANVGNGKPVSVSGISAGGVDAGNYTINTTASTTADITPYLLMLQGTRVYDGTTNAAASLFGSNGVLTGVNGETLILSGTGTLASKNASSAQPFATNGLAGYTLTGNNGALASNYTLGTGVGDWVSITRKALLVTAVGQDKAYDGNNIAQLSRFTVNGLVAGDNASLAYTNALFAQANVGNNIPITVNGISGSGADIGNYTFPGSVTTSANITGYILNLTGMRTYDGSANAAASLFGNNGVLAGVNGETLTLGGYGTLVNKNAGTQKPFAPNGLATFTLTGNNGAAAGNYTLAGGIDWVTINPLAITLSTSALDKVYDGSTIAQATLIRAGVLAGDTVNFSYGAANFDTKDVGNGKTVTVTGITDSGADAANYSFNTSATTTANITPYILDLTGLRIYDATRVADASMFGSNGVLTGANGETLTLGGSGLLVDKNVGIQKSFAPLGINGFTLTGNNGALASNYTFTGGTDWVTILPKPIIVTANAADKVYDGTTNVTLLSANYGGIIAGDNVVASYQSAAFVSPNAGTDVPIVIRGATLTGADAGNYVYPSIVQTTATIFPYVLNLTGTRVYDGTDLASPVLFGNQGVLTGINGETLTLGGNGTLIDKNVGNQKPFASNGLTNFSLSGNNGALASNYTLTGGTDWVTITPLAINVTATANNKTYDGNTAATVNLTSNGVLAGDSVTFSDGSANFDTKDAGVGKQVTVNGISASGADAGNYTFNITTAAQANINPAILNLTGTRVYDATTGASASLFGNGGVLTGVNGETLTLSGSGTLADKNVGSQKAFAANGLSGFTLSGNNGALASNYTLAGGIDWLTVTPATLTVTGTQTTDRPYDGTTLDNLSGSSLAGVQGNDNVVLGNDTTGNFNDPNVGNDKPVNTHMTLSGADAGNYVLVQPTDLTADITQPIGPPTPPLPDPFPLGYVAALQALATHSDIETPFGTARDNATGVYTGNQKQDDQHPMERNRIRSDFHPGLPLQVVDGGVRLPENKSP
ncbi:YDG domain-containing protein [Dyella telluris]|nr:YDG domain-containing protein [Dyella telluris]